MIDRLFEEIKEIDVEALDDDQLMELIKEKRGKFEDEIQGNAFLREVVESLS